RAPADREPHADHPGPRRAVRGSRRPDSLPLECAPEATPRPPRHVTPATAYAERLRRSRLADGRTWAIVGIGLGVLACWVAIPPFTVRATIWPVLVGVLAVAAGIWAVSRGAGKAGSWFLGILIAMLAGGLLALVHAFFAIHLRADQIVAGMAINFLALGITGYFFYQLYHGANIPPNIPRIPNVNRCTLTVGPGPC